LHLLADTPNEIIASIGHPSAGKPDPILYFYEHFPAAYDSVERIAKGVYFAPSIGEVRYETWPAVPEIFPANNSGVKSRCGEHVRRSTASPKQPGWPTTAGPTVRPEAPFWSYTGGERYGRFWEWIEACFPAERHWLLDQLAVEPEAQGRGIGTAMLRFAMQRAAADGLPLFLETGLARNVTYYERFGFGVMRDADAPGGGPHVWFMRRDAGA
jgi:GNAT superfamily N-acetyltransferase